ncbi:MAG: hypothetical protein SGJ19_19610 [Planctomycetia bacterium]|nr:hypothetical protein [Planctomycetia bacterium]
MAQQLPRVRPSQYDGTQFVVYVDLPPRTWTTADLHQHVYGVRLNETLDVRCKRRPAIN